MRFDLVLAGGHVIDPASALDGRRDVAFAAGRVAAVDAHIPPAGARELVDVAGAYVAPGLVDLHAHAFIASHDLGIDTDAVCRSTGVTTLCDAGSAGASNFPGLREYVIERAETRVLAFVHLSAIGLTHTAIGEHCLLDYSNPDLAAATAASTGTSSWASRFGSKWRWWAPTASSRSAEGSGRPSRPGCP